MYFSTISIKVKSSSSAWKNVFLILVIDKKKSWYPHYTKNYQSRKTQFHTTMRRRRNHCCADEGCAGGYKHVKKETSSENVSWHPLKYNFALFYKVDFVKACWLSNFIVTYIWPSNIGLIYNSCCSSGNGVREDYTSASSVNFYFLNWMFIITLQSIPGVNKLLWQPNTVATCFSLNEVLLKPRYTILLFTV